MRPSMTADARPAMTVAAAAGGLRRPFPAVGVLLAVLGVVYGDIGTSPLYAFKASLQLFRGVPITDDRGASASCR